MNKFRTAAIQILSEVKKPLHYKDITKLALDKGILETEGATPDQSMNAQIITDINKKGEGSDFIKSAPSTFALNPNKKVIEPKQHKKVLEEEDTTVGYLLGESEDTQFFKNPLILERLKDIQKFSDKEQEHIFITLDALIRDFKNKKAYAS